MPKVTDLASLKAVAKDLDADLRAVLEKYGMTMTRRSGAIGATELTIKMVCALGAGEDFAAIAEKKWNQLAPLYGINPSYLGKKFRLGAKVFKVVGIESRRSSDKVIKLERLPDGKTFVADVGQLTERNIVA